MKEYLGDSVYVEIERGMLKLTTDNGLGPSNTIYLDAVVYNALHRYVSQRCAVQLQGNDYEIVERELNVGPVDQQQQE